MPAHEDDAEVPVVGEPDVGAAAHRPRRADLAALVAGRRYDERRAAHPVLAEGGLVQQPRGEEQAVHGGEIVGRQAERAVWGFGYPGGHAVSPRTVLGG